MRITESQLRAIVRQEARRLHEAMDPAHPNLMPREFFIDLRTLMRDVEREGGVPLEDVMRAPSRRESLRLANEYDLLRTDSGLVVFTPAGQEWFDNYARVR